jgi:hypothetical protein
MNSQLNQAGTGWTVTMRAGAQKRTFRSKRSVPSLTDVGSVHPSAPACKHTHTQHPSATGVGPEEPS